MWYTADVCRGEASELREAQMSFPSGHACAAFAGFGFLALYFNAKFGVLGRKSGPQDGEGGGSERRGGGARIPHWRLVLFVAPLLLAVLMAASKIRDMWHHPEDVVFGACVGSLFALMAYRMVYRGVWDQERNHVAREVGGEDVRGGDGAGAKGYVV